MSSRARIAGLLAAVFFIGGAPESSYAAGDRGDPILAGVYAGDDSGLLVLVRQAGGGRQAANRGGGGRAHANRQVRNKSHSSVNHHRSAGARSANRNFSANRNLNANRNVGGNVNRNVGGNVNRNLGGNVNRNLGGNVNRNFNVDRNVNIDRNVNVDFDRPWYGDWDDHWHPLATAAAVTATAAVVGSIVNTLPPSCAPVLVNGLTYSQCGSTWYQPQYAGTSVQYVAVNPPR